MFVERNERWHEIMFNVVGGAELSSALSQLPIAAVLEYLGRNIRSPSQNQI